MTKDSTHNILLYQMVRITLSLGLGLLLSGCASGYYFKAAKGHLNILQRAQPIETLIADVNTDGKLKGRLHFIQQVRQFASDQLALPDNNSYRRYTDLNRPYATWNVVASEKLSIGGHQWCYPIIGCQVYRGYFDEEEAQALADLLRPDYDVIVYGVSAYSTLGWSADPVLNTFLHRNDAWLAGLIFHELSHQILYVKDDTTFNESFATAVEELGVLAWQRANGGEENLAYMQRSNAFSAVMLAARDRLDRLYVNAQLDAEEKLKAKNAEFVTIYRQCQQILQNSRYCQRFTHANNAWLLLYSSYDGQKQAFMDLHACLNGDWRQFYSVVKSLAKEEKSVRDSVLGKITTDCAAASQL